MICDVIYDIFGQVHLDDCLRGLVKTYLTKLDPENQLELTNQSMVMSLHVIHVIHVKHSHTCHHVQVCYQCGNIRRVFKSPEPERRPSLLPDTRIWVSFRWPGSSSGLSLRSSSLIRIVTKIIITHQDCHQDHHHSSELIIIRIVTI